MEHLSPNVHLFLFFATWIVVIGFVIVYVRYCTNELERTFKRLPGLNLAPGELVQALALRMSLEKEITVVATPSAEAVIPVKARTAMVCLKFRNAVDAERFRLAVIASTRG